MTFWKWSRTAASNATADGTVNWAEGMAPSAVNDSARAMMAAAAKYRDDMAGATVTGGTAAAYTLSTHQAFDSLANMHGQPVAFVMNATNTGPCTLNVDGLGAKPLRSTDGADLGPGVLIANTPYAATYFNSTGQWILHGFYGNPYNIPLGGMLDYTGVSAPNSAFVLPYGQAISRTTYASYFTLVGTTFGAGDGSSTFNVIDMRGRAAFGKANMGGLDNGLLTVAGSGLNGTSLGHTGGAQSVTLARANLPNVTLGVNGTISSTQRAPSSGAGGQATQAGSPFAMYTTDAFSEIVITFNLNTVSINGGVTQTEVNNLPPAIVVNKLLRIV